MKNRKVRTATIILVILWLLSDISIISNAENIPISEEGLAKIGLNKIRLESGIGVLVFNLTTSTDRLKGDGYLTVSNTYNSSVIISCQIVTKLSYVDLDEEQKPRLHPVISDNIIFNPISDESWITLEDTKAVIDPYSIYNFRYEVDIPLSEEESFDASKGYLLYIHIKKNLGDVTGANIGIDYNYKLFLIFTGVQKQEQNTLVMYLFMLSIPIIVSGVVLVLHKKRKQKKTIAPPIPTQAEINKIFPVTPRKTAEETMRQKIDRLTQKDRGEK